MNKLKKKLTGGVRSEVLDWSGSLYKTLDSYINEYILNNDNNFSKKRCIYFIYILDHITLKITESHGFDVSNMIQGSINNFVNSSLESNDCDLFSRS